MSPLPNSLLLTFRSQKTSFAQCFPSNAISSSTCTKSSLALPSPSSTSYFCHTSRISQQTEWHHLYANQNAAPLSPMQPITNPAFFFLLSLFRISCSSLQSSCLQGWEAILDPSYSLHYFNPSSTQLWQWIFWSLNRMCYKGTSTLLNYNI